MQIFIIPRKNIWITCIIIFMIVMLCFSYWIIRTPKTFAVELLDNSVISDEFKNKISNLTNGEEKIAYLTFDDGPNPSITPKVLDILKSEDVKATFFVIGKNVESYPEIVKRAYEEGYYVFRFPNGYMSSQNKAKKKNAIRLLSKINYSYIDWNCLNNDSMKKYSKEQLLQNLKKCCQNKNTLVILMHDTKDVSDSSEALEDSIKYLKEKGYKFENFYDLVG